MIPQSLHIKNFLSYGADTQIIDFRPYHLMYLSGKNGHGKSALLDAMTWALWGHARKMTNAVKPDQGLLRLGATQMMVLFDFQIGDQSYRVKREFIQTQTKQLAYLEFGLINEEGAIVPLTDKTIRATQDVIERTIRLDYESFINSAFLRQGHANEFSQKSPKDRKEILSTILGLQQFDRLKRCALERVKKAMDERHAITAVQTTLATQLADGENIALQKEQLHTAIKVIQQEEQELAFEKKAFDTAMEKYRGAQKEYELVLFKQAHAQRAYKEHCDILNQLWRQWRLIHGKQLRLPDYKELEAQKKEAVQKVHYYQQLLQKRLTLQTTIIKYKEALQEQERRIQMASTSGMQQQEITLERFKFEYQTHEKNYTALLALQKDLTVLHNTQLQNKEAALKKSIQVDQLEKMRVQFEKRKNVYQQFLAKATWLQNEYENVEQRKEVAHSNDPSCPLCEQNLSAARRKFLAQRLSRHERLIIHQRKRLQLIIARLKQLLIEQHHYLEQQTELHNHRAVLDKELASLQQKIDENEQHLKRMQQERASLIATIDQQAMNLKKSQQEAITLLASDPQCKEYQEIIRTHTAELMVLVYHQADHTNAQQLSDLLEKKIADLMVLNHEILNQQERAAQIKKAVQTLKEQKSELKKNREVEKEVRVLDEEKNRLSTIEKRYNQQVQLLQEKKEKTREDHGRIKTRQEQIDRIEKERKKYQEALEKLAKEIEDYQIIAAAAGRDGIQALLIEEAIPEIEQEANYLLSKLTNNQAHIFIESLRDLKSGGSKETLDINISDPSGIRPYEMFSGGEAFRIDFSLRIAISKLLARRAGTALQTLIIDEGFGSQDEEGLSLIMDALYKVQDDFQKVIVVSHLPSMRDQFPVHLVVEKGPSGSKVSVMEQG